MKRGTESKLWLLELQVIRKKILFHPLSHLWDVCICVCIILHMCGYVFTYMPVNRGLELKSGLFLNPSSTLFIDTKALSQDQSSLMWLVSC